MPPALAVAIASLAVTAGAGAYEGYENAQQPGQQQAALDAQSKSAQSAQQLAATQAASQKQQAINAQEANAQENTGGSLNAPGLTNLSSLLAGYGGQAGGANPITNPFQQPGGSSSGPGLQDALSQLTSQTQQTQPAASFSGGS